ncbi:MULTISPECIES: VapE domain-containing protein [unclassified Sphingopyxis]|uniref:VapE domain-containing protein n=1 Tax=unclassified Sphingopyxis TaxID=2614943 RepID=UPI00285C3D01|nr:MULTISPECIES: VapE domain-containing protein [unclassified Sphingopyxis]MDR7061212.1 hypothetical protein [Sphingopyxis sp. BE235]MDR7182057.1 hypothetical protein [Sphingopyxis sp. BE249]
MSIIAKIRPYVAAGFSVHWLKAQSKAPVESAWSTLPRKTLDQLEASYSADLNVGVRLGEYSKVGGGYLHAIDLDIRKDDLVDEAHSRLAALFPTYTTLPHVISGSGGESRHFYFVSDKPFASRKLGRSEGFSMVFDPAKGRPVKKHDWEIDLFGTGKQVAMPPSVHPETGAEYAWGRDFDWSMLDLGIAPTIPANHIEGIAVVSEGGADADARPPIGLTLGQARDHVMALPTEQWCIDRDGWTNVGMALHHEFAGRGLAGEAFGLWCEFSGQSDKFDINDARRVWVSFKDTKSRNIRMATIMQAARLARFERMFEGTIEAQGDGFDETPGDDAQTPSAPPESGAKADGAAEFQASSAPGIDDLLGAPAAANDDDDLIERVKPGTPINPGLDNPLGDLDDLMEKGKPAGSAAEWMSKLDFNDDGGIRPTLPNIRLIVAHDIRIRGVLAYNEFSEGLVRMGTPGKLVKKRDGAQGTKQLFGSIWERRDNVNGDLWKDVHDHAVRDLIETPGRMGGYGVKVSDRDLTAAISMAASDNLFHPVRNYLDRLEWDGKSRLDTLFVRYFGAPDNPYTRGVARMMMIAGVTRIYEPGHKFDYAVILEGMQGKRKTTFIETLACHWFGELASEFDNTNKMIESMQNAWIIEIPELSGFSKHDVQAIKAFISRRVDRARLAWAKRAQDYHRQCIFIGSTNDAKYLRDETGGRRFWPVECLLDEDSNIDIEALREEVEQLWAEARAGYRAMRAEQPNGPLPLYLADAEANEEAERLQESRRVETVEDAMAGQIAGWLEMPISKGDGFADDEKVLRNATCLKQVWIEGLGNDPRSYNAQAAQTVGRAFQRIKGWDNRSTRTRDFGKYGKQRAYFRGAARADLDRGGLDLIF